LFAFLFGARELFFKTSNKIHRVHFTASLAIFHEIPKCVGNPEATGYIYLCVKRPYFTSGEIKWAWVVNRPFYVFLLDACEIGVSRSSPKIASAFHKWPGYI
jgi:hypothetical protein